MTVISIEIPEAQVNRVVKGLCGIFGYEPTGPNAKLALTQLIRNHVVEQERQAARVQAEQGLAPAPEGLT